MKTFNIGDVTYGKSHASMINKAIGTNYDGYMKAVVDLKQFGVPDVVAWFIFMDGSEHGFSGQGWKNLLSSDGNEILEYCTAPSKAATIARRNSEGYLPYRLCFRLDPYEKMDRHCCKFVGAFSFSSFVKDDLSAIKYTKIAEAFSIGSMGEVGSYLGRKVDFF